jgi:hypothetical protein
MDLISVTGIARLQLARQAVMWASFPGSVKEASNGLIGLMSVEEFSKHHRSIRRWSGMPPSIGIQRFGWPSDARVPAEGIEDINNGLDLFLGWLVGRTAREHTGLRGLVMNPIGIGKKAVLGYNLGRETPSGMGSVPSLEPVIGIEEAGGCHQSMGIP